MFVERPHSWSPLGETLRSNVGIYNDWISGEVNTVFWENIDGDILTRFLSRSQDLASPESMKWTLTEWRVYNAEVGTSAVLEGERTP
jgi:hypothetical protein